MTHLRLLPWDGPEGKPARTPDDNPNGMISLLADAIEKEQLDCGISVLELARGMLRPDAALTDDEARYVMMRLTECLADVLRVAKSRGERLPGSDAKE